MRGFIAQRPLERWVVRHSLLTLLNWAIIAFLKPWNCTQISQYI